MRIIVCDDDIKITDYIKQKIYRYSPEADVVCFCDTKALSEYVENNSVDMLFIDIVLANENGIDVATKITSDHPDILTVFITAYAEEFSEKIFLKIKPFGYLHKPIKDDMLKHYLDSANYEIKLRNQTLFIKIGADCIDIPFSEISYIECEKRLSRIHAGNSAVFDTYEKLDELSEKLDKKFIRCHKSYIVNCDHISEIRKNCFTLSDGTEIPISKSRISAARVSYFKAKGRELK